MKIRQIKNGPVMPKDAADPAHQKKNLSREQRELKVRFERILTGVRKLVADQANYRTVSAVNKEWKPLVYFTNAQGELDTHRSSIAVNKTTYYEYQIDVARYESINEFIERLLYDEILESYTGKKPPNWFFQSYLSKAFNDGINDTIQDIKNQSTPSLVGDIVSRQIQSLSSDEFNPQATQSLALVYGRVFNEMKGLTDSMKVDLSETLTRGMADGLGIRAISADVQKRVGVGFSRAQRIARTEILGAYRTAQRAKTKEINETVFDDSPYEFKQLWFSALAESSRPWHVSKHGGIFTQQEVEEFYSKNGNSIQCLCSQSPILVDKKTGKPLIDDTVKRMDEQRKKYQATH
ncbi:phage minor head protein [Pseudoalteromonas marina]|uniref:phage minor head protein n=1 Tax=Pseudoalteromonas marina TaxID=267375 RepID=UPI0023F48784|nr:phage minor head protein [Pseudoalteromonas marina]